MELNLNNLFYVDVYVENTEDDDYVTVYEGVVKFDTVEEVKEHFSKCYGEGYFIDISRLRVDELPICSAKF